MKGVSTRATLDLDEIYPARPDSYMRSYVNVRVATGSTTYFPMSLSAVNDISHSPTQTSTVWYIFKNVPLKTFYPFDQCHVLDMSPDIIMVAHSRELECRPGWSDGGWWMRETALLDICLREAIILQKCSFFNIFDWTTKVLSPWKQTVVD